jgi:hypothetical protein
MLRAAAAVWMICQLDSAAPDVRALQATPAQDTHVRPQRLAIYYGYPTRVENAGGDVTRAAAVFSRYDVLVLGDGLELPVDETPDAGARAERQQLAELIALLHAPSRRSEIYGYIDLGSTQQLPAAEIERRVDAWRRAGVDGIFFDEAGSDFGVAPERRHAAVRAVHRRGLSAFMNSFNPDDLFAGDTDDPAGCGLLGRRDALLIESFAVRNGASEPADQIDARAAVALKWRERCGVRVFGITTTDGRRFSREQFQAAWQHAVARALDGFGWGEKDFSADSRLPWREQ